MERITFAKKISDDGSAVPLMGMTNTAFVIQYKGSPHVIKFPGAGTERFINRSREQICEELAFEEGLTPKVTYCDGGAYKLSPFLQGTRHLAAEDDLLPLMRVLTKFHHLAMDPMDAANLYVDLHGEVQTYTAMGGNNPYGGSEYPGLYHYYVNFMEQRSKDHPVLAHRDLVPQNILLTDGEHRIDLIDFEYSGRCNLYWDLGSLAAELEECRGVPRMEAVERVASAYRVAASFDVQEREVLRWSYAIDFVWSLWAAAKGREYEVYGTRRYRKCRDFFINRLPRTA